MGLHTGTAEVRDGDYFGSEVIRAARISAAGHGGQILASATTAGLVDRRDLRSLGRHRFKGFHDDIEVFQLGTAVFPPIRSITPRRHNLSQHAVTLIGRDDEVDRMLELTESNRLVTVTGAGGIGKTSLAAAIAHRLADRDDSEVWWCDLVSADDDDVVLRVAESIGLRTGTDDAAAVARALSHRDAVWLVIDNCEHVRARVATAVEELLRGSDVRVITTSRRPLNVAGEAVMPLGPLSTDDDAVELFVRHASNRGLDVGDHREAIARICRRLDGVPLAVVLAAAHTRTLSPVDIETRLDRLLTPSHSARGESGRRHETITATIDWSVDLLDEAATAALGELAVFAGSFDLTAAEAILDVPVDGDPVLVLAELVDHSLVESFVTHGLVRYRLLEPIRQHAAARLWQNPDATRNRHLEHYLRRLEDAHDALATTSSAPMQSLVDFEMDNLGAVHGWALRSGRIDDDLRLYRPLMLTDEQDVFEPGKWALRTLETPGIERHERWREALAKAFQTSVFQSFWTVDDESSSLRDRLERAGPGPGTDLIETELAWIEGTRERRFADSAARWDAIASDDPFTIYLRYMIGSFARAAGSPDRLAVARSEFGRGIEWARSIGAVGFEAALRAQAAHIELACGGDPQASYDQACEAAALAEQLHRVEWTAVICRTNAVFAGASATHDPLTDVVDTIRSSIRSGNEVRLASALNAAVELLADAGRDDAAALAGIGGEPADRRPLRRICTDTVERARALVAAEGLDLTAIARRTARELGDLTI
jgi:predicted ATPase